MKKNIIMKTTKKEIKKVSKDVNSDEIKTKDEETKINEDEMSNVVGEDISKKVFTAIDKGEKKIKEIREDIDLNKSIINEIVLNIDKEIDLVKKAQKDKEIIEYFREEKIDKLLKLTEEIKNLKIQLEEKINEKKSKDIQIKKIKTDKENLETLNSRLKNEMIQLLVDATKDEHTDEDWENFFFPKE